MADTAFKIKVDDRTFTLDRITLGDWRMLKTEFGLTASDIVQTVTLEGGEQADIFNVGDPSVLVGLMVAALRHERPHAPLQNLIAEVEALGMDSIEFPRDEGENENEPDPTEGGDAAEETGSRSKPGSSAKRPKKPGTPR